VQDQNGPCGPLAVINAMLVVRMFEREGVLDHKRHSTEEEVFDTLAAIIERCCGDDNRDECFIAHWTTRVGCGVDVHVLKRGEEVRAFMLDRAISYHGPGCLVLLVSLCKIIIHHVARCYY
jgi:hypothetical protein